MDPPDDTAYAAAVDRIARARDMIDRLEAEPLSPKRTESLTLLREALGRAIRRLDEIRSEDHHN